MASGSVVKRSRGSNFSTFEKELLIELVTQYKETIERKKTDCLKNKEKDMTWMKIQNEFNSNQLVTVRSVKQLKQFYTNIKRSAKAAVSEERIEKLKTGGGKFTTMVNENILSLIEDQIDPQANLYDCDAEYYGDCETVSPCNVEVLAVVDENEHYNTTTPEESTTLQDNRPKSPSMEMLSMEATTTVVKDSPGVARYTRKQPFSSSRTSKANLCWENIAALAESRANLCETEKSLLESKYQHEINLLKMKMANERLKEEALREKIKYYKDKRIRMNLED